MSDWQPGDLALCVQSGKETRKGCIYTVIRVTGPGEMAGEYMNYENFDLLDFSEFGLGDMNGADARRFVKVTPGADIKGIEAEKRIRVGEPA